LGRTHHIPHVIPPLGPITGVSPVIPREGQPAGSLDGEVISCSSASLGKEETKDDETQAPQSAK
jgi:hypothetical protein